MATLTTSPQVIGKNEGGTIRTYLYGWYDGQSGNNCTVHTRLTVVNTGATYTGTNKSYAIRLGSYDSGVQSWSYQPLNPNQEYTVAEASQGYSGGAQISANALFWSYVYGSADIASLTTNWYVPTFVSPPTGLTVSVNEAYTNGAKLNVSISSYGNPSTASGRYIEGAILSTNSYGNPYKRTVATAVTSSAVTITNDSSTGGNLTIQPNTQYYYGGYADNTQAHVNTITGQFVTLAEAATVTLNSVTGRTATFNYSVGADGGQYDRKLEYSLDGVTWTTAATITTGSAETGTFTITGLDGNTSYTLKSRIKTTAGISNDTDVSFTTLHLLYGSVGDTAKGINKLYGSVGGQTKEITKLYGSVGGVTKRIF